MSVRSTVDGHTHGVGCWTWHRGHYECALAEIKRLNDALNNAWDALNEIRGDAQEAENKAFKALDVASHEYVDCPVGTGCEKCSKPACFFCGFTLEEHANNAQGHPWRLGITVTAEDLEINRTADQPSEPRA